MNILVGVGVSSVSSKACHEAEDSAWHSSMTNTLYFVPMGLNLESSISFLISSTPLWDAASNSIILLFELFTYLANKRADVVFPVPAEPQNK